MDSLLVFPSEEAKIYSVSQLNARIKDLMESAYPFVGVTGEISSLRTPASGHHYFVLKDEQSQLRAVMFRTQQRALRFTPQSGLEVLCQGRLTVYEPRGEYQLIVESMEPKGVGALQIAFEQLKKKLGAEGLFDVERKLQLPVSPQRIAIITSPTGAAIRDILKVMQLSPHPLSVTIFPVRVQGQEAAAEIAAAVVAANKVATQLDLDLIIVGRGGGSLEDLWAFNEEVVARAIAASEVPVISAVGHEIDFTIADAVADMRAPTPTAAAQWVVSSHEVLQREISSRSDRMYRIMSQRIGSIRQQVSYLQKRLISPKRRLEDLRLFVDDRSDRIHQSFARHIEKLRTSCRHLEDKLLFHNPVKSVRQHQTVVNQRERELSVHYHNVLDKYRLGLRKYMSQLESLNPLAVLMRGYSITYRLPEGKVVRKADDVPVGCRIRIQLSEGALEGVVERVEPEDTPSLKGMQREQKKSEQFEDALKRLDNIVERMERGNLPLEEAMEAFTEGVRLVKLCHEKLEEAEAKIQLFLGTQDGGNQAVVAPFEAPSTNDSTD